MKIYSTGDIAKIMSISPQKVVSCCESGLLVFYRVPGSRFRRIRHDEFIAFLKREGIDLEMFDLSEEDPEKTPSS